MITMEEIRKPIDVGDIVNIHWEHVTALHNVQIQHTPTQAEDYFIVQDTAGGIYYIKVFARMDLIKSFNELKNGDQK